ncbi:MAG: TIGR04283 family arsenosugar biosynthesis glycosyltransferase [bacterium]|nr:TIGR04283 family arsenosugar biosynthesis glycosyltransferase [bacterium]
MISVIIPTLNEELALGKSLVLARNSKEVEIIVSDGGSDDDTLAIAKRLADKVISSPAGRGVQMNRGAAAASGDILIFLHADTSLPADWDDLVRETLRDEEIAGGAFSFSLSDSSIPFSLISLMVNIRSRLLKLPYGDQAIFARRALFEKLGGFREIPIMEDVELVKGMRRLGRIKMLDLSVITSSRRWEKEGWIRTTVRNLFLLFLYHLGVSPERLYRFYKAVR